MTLKTWDERQRLESEADKLRAEAELARTTPEFIKASVEASQMKSTSVDKRRRRSVLHVAGRSFVKTVGPAACIHLIWASSCVAICWILVVYGWRG